MKHKTKLLLCLMLSLGYWVVVPAMAAANGIGLKEVARGFVFLWLGGLLWSTLIKIFGDQ